MKRFFLLQDKWGDGHQRLYTLGGRYLKVLEQRITLPLGKYRVVPTSRGSWRFVERGPNDAYCVTYYDLQHLVRGRWMTIKAPEWCALEVEAFGLGAGQRFTVRRAK